MKQSFETAPPTDATARRLLDEAVRAFAARGFDGVSVRDIVKPAGANVAAVNYHFRSKENLYEAAVRQAYSVCVAGLVMDEMPREGPPEKRLRGFIKALARHMLDLPDPAAMQLMMREMLSPTTQACAEWVDRYIRPMAHHLKGMLHELLPAGTPDVKIWQTGFSIVGQCLYYRQNREVVRQLVGEKMLSAVCDAEALGDHIADFTLAALGKAKRGAR